MEIFCTDLGSHIGNFDCEKSPVWKFSNFPATMILREINFGWFHRVKNCFFPKFWRLWILIFRNFTLKNVKTHKDSTFRAAKMVKTAVLRASKCSKLISRRKMKKIWNLHTLQCGNTRNSFSCFVKSTH